MILKYFCLAPGFAAPEPRLLHHQHHRRPAPARLRRRAPPHLLHGQDEGELRIKSHNLYIHQLLQIILIDSYGNTPLK